MKFPQNQPNDEMVELPSWERCQKWRGHPSFECKLTNHHSIDIKLGTARTQKLWPDQDLEVGGPTFELGYSQSW